jgi:predicted transcriptional regulator of viral defense system
LSRLPGKVYVQLAELANEQYGLLTPDDARRLAIDPMNLVRMAERGQLERRANGVYRFPLTPVSPLDSFMEAVLWPRGMRGVLSHETALNIYELSDVLPGTVDITVPRAHRIRRAAPPHCRIHHEDLRANQITAHQGIPIVKPAHAVRQGHRAQLAPTLLARAIDRGRRNGRLTQRQAKVLQQEVGGSAATKADTR